MLLKILRKLHNFFLLPLTFKNWLRVVLYILSPVKPETGLAVLRNGQRLRLRLTNTLDIGSVIETYKRKVYTPSFFKIPENPVIIDIGASIGDFSVYCAYTFKNAEVFSYEPTPEAFKLVNENIRLNNLEDNIKVFPLAVSGTKKKISIGAELYESASIEDIFKYNKIDRCDLLKMDIEGGEYETLLNTRKEVLKKINKIAMECHIFGTVKDLSKLKDYLIKTGSFEVITTPINIHNICYLYAIRK